MLKALERETGIEPATNGLGSRDSTTELLPLELSLLQRSSSSARGEQSVTPSKFARNFARDRRQRQLGLALTRPQRL